MDMFGLISMIFFLLCFHTDLLHESVILQSGWMHTPHLAYRSFIGDSEENIMFLFKN